MAKLIEVNCAHCDKPTTIELRKYKFRIKNNPNTKFFCSKECLKFKTERVQLTCQECKIQFERRITEVTENNFCSQSCAAKFNNAYRMVSNFTTKGKVKKLICVDCENIFEGSIHTAISKAQCNSCMPTPTLKIKRIKKIKLIKARKPPVPKILDESGNWFVMQCFSCPNLIGAKKPYHRRNCSICLVKIRREAGLKSVASQQTARRSKNEIHFANLCKEKFDILENEPMFEGWDADVVILSIKVAVLWNGMWHYKKIRAKHSFLQVQARDKIKIHKIENAGYTPYVIKDLGKHNPEFVQEQFNTFIKWLENKDKEDPQCSNYISTIPT